MDTETILYNLVVALPLDAINKLQGLTEDMGCEDYNHAIHCCIVNTWFDIHPDNDDESEIDE